MLVFSYLILCIMFCSLSSVVGSLLWMVVCGFGFDLRSILGIRCDHDVGREIAGCAGEWGE